jgi:hypothetical protein
MVVSFLPFFHRFLIHFRSMFRQSHWMDQAPCCLRSYGTQYFPGLGSYRQGNTRTSEARHNISRRCRRVNPLEDLVNMFSEVEMRLSYISREFVQYHDASKLRNPEWFEILIAFSFAFAHETIFSKQSLTPCFHCLSLLAAIAFLLTSFSGHLNHSGIFDHVFVRLAAHSRWPHDERTSAVLPTDWTESYHGYRWTYLQAEQLAITEVYRIHFLSPTDTEIWQMTCRAKILEKREETGSRQQ